jgi:hypothetical protein
VLEVETKETAKRRPLRSDGADFRERRGGSAMPRPSLTPPNSRFRLPICESRTGRVVSLQRARRRASFCLWARARLLLGQRSVRTLQAQCTMRLHLPRRAQDLAEYGRAAGRLIEPTCGLGGAYRAVLRIRQWVASAEWRTPSPPSFVLDGRLHQFIGELTKEKPREPGLRSIRISL